jgi:hypothetical protein
MTQLRFFEVGCNPNFVEGHNVEQNLSRLDVHSDDNILIHRATDRRYDLRVLQVKFGLLQRRSLLFDISLR